MNLSLLGYSLSLLLRKKGKSVAIFGGLFAMVLFVSAVLFAADAMNEEAMRAHDVLPDLVVSRLSGGRPRPAHEKDAALFRDIPSVGSSVGRVWGYVFVEGLHANVTVIGVREEGAHALSLVSGALAEGSGIALGHHQMVAGKGLVKALGLRVNDSFVLSGERRDVPTLTLVGTFSSAVDLYTADVVLCDESDARTILGYAPEEVTDIAIRLINPAETNVVAQSVLEKMPDARVVQRSLLGRIYSLVYGRRSGVLIALSIPAFLAFLVIAWDRLVGIAPDERKEIAVLKATGWSTRDVLLAKGLESALLSTVATASGLTLSYVWVFVFGAAGLRPALGGFSIVTPTAPLTPAIDASLLLTLFLSIVGPFIALSLVPAWRAASIDPVDAMKST